jgi:hypothetical protein
MGTGRELGRQLIHALLLSLTLTILLLRLPTNSAGYSNPPSLTPQALKKLIEKRNERFSLAVEEYGIVHFALSSNYSVLLI